MKADVYATDRRVDNTVERLQNSSMSSHNVELLESFYQDALVGGVPGTSSLKKITVQGNLTCFDIMSSEISFRLDEAGKDELKDLVLKINQDEISEGRSSPWALLDYKRALKNFYKWLYDNEDPAVIDFMSVHVKSSEKPKVDPEELLSVRDAEKMINSAYNSRDKALMGLLWDTGMRISELLNLNIEDVRFRDELMSVNVRHGKIGPRKLYLVESQPLVRNWLTEHPCRREGKPLFTILQASNSCSGVERQSYASVSKQLNACAERSEVDGFKRWNPHGWRRARATDMARKGMNQPNMNQFFGWVPNSDVPQYYIRLAERDVERSIRKIYPGISPLQEDGPQYLGENIPEYSQSDLRAYEES